jgi:hypothetical protein
MARLNIDTGTAGNSATGDTLRTAMTKINTNFGELFDVHTDTGLITTSLTNGDIRIQPNGTGTIEIDQLQIDSSAITSTGTNSNLTLTANGTGNIVLDAVTISDNKISTNASNTNLQLDASGTGAVEITSDAVFLSGTLPTSDPSVAGKLWRNGNDLKISTG